MIGGEVAAGFEPVREAFAAEIDRDRGAGAAFAAVVDGTAVVDLWGGSMRPEPPTPWREDTVQLVFSGTKGLVATCILLLLERGKLNLDRPVSAYWPEFEQAGKGNVLVRHLVSHQAGLPAVDPPPTPYEALDPIAMAERLAQQPALWPAGTSITYHALTFGWLCDGLIRHVDGRSPGRFFADEVAGPLSLDAWIGLPASVEARVARMQRAPDYQVNYGEVSDSERLLLDRIYAGGGFIGERFVVNDPEFLAAEIAGANGVASARSMARLYGCLARGGEIDGIRLLSPETVRFAYAPIAAGLDRLTRKPAAFSTGFEIQSETQWYGPAVQAFGHSGAGGSVHGAWPHLRTGFSYAMNLMRRDDRDGRAQRILTALHGVIAREVLGVPVRSI
ncbi:MAG TPA: serine hydrolase domain-containing protein [Candidatus Angelobacter sp.]|nr:serine hydrolase domain-containing protein [Candidatus Angelobacter sp.]